MDVKFAEYRFVRDQLILYKNEEIIELKRNQALLLDFFIANPDGIHSKDAIMDSVWHNKVVSEQVVFQTISQLRAILGSEAIKTFSRKGYKWELELCHNIAINCEAINNEHNNSVLAVKVTKIAKQKYWLMFAFGLFIIIAIYLVQAQTAKEPVALHLVQSANLTADSQKTLARLTQKTISQDDAFTVELTPGKYSSRQLFSAPTLAWQQSNVLEHEWLLWTETFSSSKGIFLNYGLSRDTTYWHGYVFAETNELVAQKLSERLKQLRQLGLFTMLNSQLDLSTLMSMKQIAPDDPDLLLLLANYYFDVKQYEVAMTYAQKLINLDPSYSFSPYRAKAKWLMAEVYKKRRKYQLATNSLNAMSAILIDTPLWALNYENISAKAWLAHSQHDFDTMFTILDNAIEFGQKQGNILTLFELHIMYSILAKKGGDDHKKYAHLNEAQALLLKHDLDESNFAVVYYHFAIFTQDNNKALPYLEKILALPRTIRNGWIIDHATEMLVDQYIEQQDFELAMSLLDKQTESPKYMISLARIFNAQHEKEKARHYFEKAFEQARLQYKTHIAIDSALMLFQLSEQGSELQAEYLAYLQRNANEKWLKKQMDILVNQP
jgi:DNA-binding winged helix-turn-helix (wHTH) protein/tetratricopeptide (TPR) repeat protein